LAGSITGYQYNRKPLVYFEGQSLPETSEIGRRPLKAIQEEFNDIDASVIINLYESLPGRVAAVQKSKGAQRSY